MGRTLKPDITAEQHTALAKLAGVLPADWYVAGGIAVAAHLHHRTSRDLDLFAQSDPTELRQALEALSGVVIEAQSRGTLQLRIDGVPASLLQYPYLLLEPARSIAGLSMPVASILDLACMKLSAIASRGAARDFWDLHSIVVVEKAPVASYLTAYRRKYPVEDLGHVLRSLVYFGDAESSPLPLGLDAKQWQTIKSDFERWVPPLVT